MVGGTSQDSLARVFGVSRATVGVKKASGPTTEVAGVPARLTALMGRRGLVLVSSARHGWCNKDSKLLVAEVDMICVYDMLGIELNK